MPTLTEQTKQKRAEYHDRPEWSYSQMKVILDSGIDYAVAKKNGLLPAPDSKAIDIGSLVTNSYSAATNNTWYRHTTISAQRNRKIGKKNKLRKVKSY